LNDAPDATEATERMMTMVTTYKKLGDFDLDDVRCFAENLRDKHDAALATVNEASGEAYDVAAHACDAAFTNEVRFDRAAAAVIPLLESNPGWTWRTAVEHMQANGTLPSLDA
jgi:hypothetical protein